MENDLISRSALKQHILNRTGLLIPKLGFAVNLVSVCSDIDNAPAVDAEPVRHGRWKVGENDFGWAEDIDCSECGSMYNFFKKPKYCPNCGAKMDMEVTDER